ncbi:MAG TPA: alpha/beta hydrolase [Thermoanaerobaculia bacterium]|nr:alpha/beta hydrolase [Thermoanaerobaculia bacterium]
MRSFTLIHGSAQNASGWARLAPLLRGDVRIPELPKNELAFSLRDYAALVGDCDVAVAHSFSGSLLPLIECNVRVFLGALIPEPRRSVRDQLMADPTMLPPEWIATGARWRNHPEEREALARQWLFHDCDEATLPWAYTTVDALDTSRLAVEPAPFDAWPSTGRDVVIVPTGDRTISPDWMRRRAREIGAEVWEVEAGHCPHVSRPDWLASKLATASAIG